MKSEINGRWPAGTERAQSLVETVAAISDDPLRGARARIWSSIEARRNRRSRAAWVFGLAVSAAAALLVARGLARFAVSPSVVAHWSGPQAIDLHGAARIAVAAGSDVTLLEDDARGIVLSVADGSVLLQVNHRPEGAPLFVRTPTADVKVVGTVLWVDVAAGATTVEVARGVVEVTPRGGAMVSLASGQRWPADAPRSPTAAEIELLGPASMEGAEFASRRPKQTLLVPIRTPFVVSPPSRASRPVCVGLDGEKESACLAQLASGNDPLRAELAEYEIGWRALRERGDAKSALAAWERQRARFPRGVLRAEADASIIEALLQLGDAARARREIDDYLGAHPDGILSSEVRFLRGSLERAAGDCARAVENFDAALREPGDPWADEARAERAACLATLRR